MGLASRRQLLRNALGAAAVLLVSDRTLARAEPFNYPWVETRWPTGLRIAPDGSDLRWLPTGILLRTGVDAIGPRLRVWCPAFGTFGTVDAGSVASVPSPTEAEIDAQRAVPVLPAFVDGVEQPGRVVGGANLRYWPNDRQDSVVSPLSHNAELWVIETVSGETGEAWYRVADRAAGSKAVREASYFVRSDFVRLPRTDFHPLEANPDRVMPQWFEVDLEEPTLLTAYEAGHPVWSSLALHGRTPNVTPTGRQRVYWRVARETMSSERVSPPIPRDAPGGYYLENVLYTQYFNKAGAAIHYNYWSTNWGYQGSHGCLGLPMTEAKWAWDWARIGTPVIVFG